MPRRAACAICTAVCALLLALGPALTERLPAPPEGLASRQYEGWSGVVRLWVYQGFKTGAGSIVPWLNERLGEYEKRNAGVYVHVKTVSLEQLRSYEDLPGPDMLIFTPGALTDASGLVALADGGSALEGACAWQGESYAEPLCYGGYGLLINLSLMDGPPADWRSALKSAYRAPAQRTGGAWALQVPGEGSWPEVARRLLGELPGAGEFTPEGYLECSEAEAWAGFKRGEIACIPASQWQLRQMELLRAGGEGFDYGFYPMQPGYTDMYFAAAIVDSAMDDAGARADACRGIIDYLTSPDAQRQLDEALMLPALCGLELYGGAGGMGLLERAYAQDVEFAPLFG